MLNRRLLLLGSITSAAALTTPVLAGAQMGYGLDAAQLGVRPGAPDDQSQRLQRAIDQAARSHTPLFLAPGLYRAGDLRLSAGAQLVGVRGATRIALTRGPTLLSGEGADSVTLSGLTLDGGGLPLPPKRGLVHLAHAKGLRISDCAIVSANGNAIALENCNGDISRNTITGSADNAIFAIDSTGLVMATNTIRGSGNGGIRVWQSVKRHDGSLIADNTIEDTEARAGGSGQNGNAINVYRGAGVIVRNNIIRRAVFSAVRGNGAGNIQIIGNNCSALKEVALYSEFDFEGAVIADNIVDTAETGISVTNFNEGGRLATVHGNVLRNLGGPRPDNPAETIGAGISVEADTAVTGNVVESAPIGIRAGWGAYLRNVTIAANVVRNAGYAIAVSVARGAGDAAVTGNLISGSKLGAIVGMEWAKAVTGDLAKDGARSFSQLTIANNQVR